MHITNTAVGTHMHNVSLTSEIASTNWKSLWNHKNKIEDDSPPSLPRGEHSKYRQLLFLFFAPCVQNMHQVELNYTKLHDFMTLWHHILDGAFHLVCCLFKWYCKWPSCIKCPRWWQCHSKHHIRAAFTLGQKSSSTSLRSSSISILWYV